MPDTGRGGWDEFQRFYYSQTDKDGMVIDGRFNHGWRRYNGRRRDHGGRFVVAEEVAPNQLRETVGQVDVVLEAVGEELPQPGPGLVQSGSLGRVGMAPFPSLR